MTTTTHAGPDTRSPRISSPAPAAQRAVRHGDGAHVPAGVAPRVQTPAPKPKRLNEHLTDRPRSRRPWKTPGRNLRADYSLHLLIGFVLSLALLWGLTFVDYEFSDDYTVTLSEQEVVEMEEVRQTKQETAPPPPLRPTTPLEVANDALIEDTRELNFDASLDLDASLDVSSIPPADAPPPKEETAEPEIFVVVEDEPVLIGGLKGLQEQIRYPVMARKAGIEGRVIVQFIIDERGHVTSPTVVRGRHQLLDEEALRVVRLARFTPGRQRGEAVRVQMALPITFILADK